ncbi:unnamed protein product [Adineta steineri]|uniref:Uncharacterized protein n=1 Tax=Adineta steineri TaxID=433720 RepID=A0A814U5F2_9BILA|nr:unnamed protein product [Adineta steineri]CAF1169045.1 unnamed protein product [Adineta steineri]CAF4217958.1 unnamed protein product [Adineta steineri]CAF4273274.1 unnamed protein product [Adineta steineri]
MNPAAWAYKFMLDRIRATVAAVVAYSSICALCTSLISFAIVLIVSLIPLYLSRNPDDAYGEVYCINNYMLTAGFQIPQYTTQFTDTMTSRMYSFTSNPTSLPGVCIGLNNYQVKETETVSVMDTCYFQLLSIISPLLPNAKVFNNYALSEACYRTLQTCYSDSLLTACILSNCVVTGLSNAASASYPLTYYTLSCAAKIYYKTRCLDAPASSGLYYSSSQRNSACRQRRLNRINTCLSSTVSLMNVPCMISVSSGLVTNSIGNCTQMVTAISAPVTVTDSSGCPSTVSPGWASTNPMSMTTLATFPSGLGVFNASDQTDGHPYRISSITSTNFYANQSGALYCGSISQAGIAAAVNTAISSQSS